ncbi:hypothetical protein BHM03_00041544 [Ensete ventricosum]|uniref:Uncharacterized protein n=1 Tax=Ensete ventricosum TaxID=4639 RepID=A0A445MKB7_ENSVE|nr:hypothetical protein BHM03_00041544 [Ensete ventricosum]
MTVERMGRDCRCNVWSRGRRGGQRRGQMLWPTRAAATTAIVAGGEEWLATAIEEESRAAMKKANWKMIG